MRCFPLSARSRDLRKTYPEDDIEALLGRPKAAWRSEVASEILHHPTAIVLDESEYHGSFKAHLRNTSENAEHLLRECIAFRDELAVCRNEIHSEAECFAFHRAEFSRQSETSSSHILRAEQRCANLEDECRVYQNQRLRDRMELLSLKTVAAFQTRCAEDALRDKAASAQLAAGLDSQCKDVTDKVIQLEAELRCAHADAEKQGESFCQREANLRSSLREMQEARVMTAEEVLALRSSLESQLELARHEEIEAITTHRLSVEVETQNHALNTALQEMQYESEEIKSRHLCCICLDERRCVVLRPCFHFALCSHCAASLVSCPVCRAEIVDRTHVIWS